MLIALKAQQNPACGQLHKSLLSNNSGPFGKHHEKPRLTSPCRYPHKSFFSFLTFWESLLCFQPLALSPFLIEKNRFFSLHYKTWLHIFSNQDSPVVRDLLGEEGTPPVRLEPDTKGRGTILNWALLYGLQVTETLFKASWGKKKVIHWNGTRTAQGFLGGSDGKESACNAGDLSLIPGSGRTPGEGNGNALQYSFLPGKSHGLRSLVGYSP